MNCLVRACERFEDYPQNIIRPGATIRNLRAHSERLEIEKHFLFCDQQFISSSQSDRQSAVDFIDINRGQDPRTERVTNLESLKHLLRRAFEPGKSDPDCRFISIHAKHSRAPLSIAQNMFKFIFSYHQVTPSFLEFIYPFGAQIGTRDAYFSAFRNESRTTASDGGVEVPQLYRSGKELRLCYNLRSVEPSGSDPQLPWSIRQCAVYHTFDVETGKALWVTVKGNDLAMDRVQDEAVLAPLSQANSRSERFTATLHMHLMLCDWSKENWRWYVNDLEEKVRNLAPGAIAIPVDKPRTPPPQPIHLLRSPTQRVGSSTTISQSPISLISPRSRSGTFPSKFPSRSSTVIADSNIKLTAESSYCSQEKRTNASKNTKKPLKQSLTSLYSTIDNIRTKPVWIEKDPPSPPSLVERQPPAVGDRQIPPEQPPTVPEAGSDVCHENFRFENLQYAEYIEGKLQDAMLHLRLNVGVLEELREFYQDELAHENLGNDIKEGCISHRVHFEKCVLGVIKDMRMLQSRIETLLQLLVNRKHLLNCILQYKSTKANDSFAQKAHDSARFMQAMTIEMHSIAKKTERETVSMRAITSVTLFFLPATFLASFMSTDILDFKDGKQDLEIAGLKIYLAIALPATVLTFLAWYCISWSAKDRTTKGEEGGSDVV